MAIFLHVFALALTASLLCSLPLSIDSPNANVNAWQISESDIFKLLGNDPFKFKIKRHLGKVGKCAVGKIWILGLCKSPNYESEESGQDDGNTVPPDEHINAIATTGKLAPDSDLFVPTTKTGTTTDRIPTSEPALEVVPLSKPEPTRATTDRSTVTHVTPPTKSVSTIEVVSSTTPASVVSTNDMEPTTKSVPTIEVVTSTTPASVVSTNDMAPMAPTTKTVPTTDILSTTVPVSTTEPDSATVRSSDIVPEMKATPNIVPTNDVELNTDDLTSTTVKPISNTVPGTKGHDENQGKEHSTGSPRTNSNYSGQTADLVLFITFFIIALLTFAYEKWLRPYVSNLRQMFRSERRNEDANEPEDVVVWPLLTTTS